MSPKSGETRQSSRIAAQTGPETGETVAGPVEEIAKIAAPAQKSSKAAAAEPKKAAKFTGSGPKSATPVPKAVGSTRSGAKRPPNLSVLDNLSLSPELEGQNVTESGPSGDSEGKKTTAATNAGNSGQKGGSAGAGNGQKSYGRSQMPRKDGKGGPNPAANALSDQDDSASDDQDSSDSEPKRPIIPHAPAARKAIQELLGKCDPNWNDCTRCIESWKNLGPKGHISAGKSWPVCDASSLQTFALSKNDPFEVSYCQKCGKNGQCLKVSFLKIWQNLANNIRLKALSRHM